MNADKRRFDVMEVDGDACADRNPLNQISERVIGAAFEVSNKLGCGFLEDMYENALAYELRQAGMEALQQEPLIVRYKGVVVGKYYTDILVDGQVIVEVKACKALSDAHVAQCLNYLKGTNIRLGLLINFGGSKVEVRRLVNKF